MNLDLLKPWTPVTDPQQKAAWKRELARECPVGHVLYGQNASFIGRRQDRDDFLVALSGEMVAVVHLTWSEESDPQWPAAQVFPSLDEWRSQVMEPDHDAWED